MRVCQHATEATTLVPKHSAHIARHDPTFPHLRIAASLALAAAGVLGTPYAQAAPAASDRVLAQTLFEQGRALVDAGKYDEACPKIAESQRLDPAGGTLLNLAVCYDKAGQTASAWATFEEALLVARRDGRSERAVFATQRIAALKAILSKVVLVVSENARVPGLGIRVDGKRIDEAAWNSEIPYDPGAHEVEVSADGKQSWTTKLRLGSPSDVVKVEVPVLANAAATPAALPSTKAVATTSPAAPSADSGAQPLGNSRVLAYALGAGGIVALGVGGYFGLRAKSSWDTRNEHCSGGACDAAAVGYGEDTKTYATIANVGVGLGLVGVGVGTYLLLRSPEGPKAASGLRIDPNVGHGTAGLSVGGVW